MGKAMFCFLGAGALLLAWVSDARAGMPAPLPTDDYVKTVSRLTDSTRMRLYAISFFVAGILLCSAAVRWLWNGLQRDFPQLPRLSFARALMGVLLWGLLFIIVLTMISGARELMTPGAWRKQGFTYKLDRPQPVVEPDPRTSRREHLEKLRTALWHFAATHEGRFPSSKEQSAVAAELWEVPETGGMKYLYVAGLSAGYAPTILVYEPELRSDERFVLKSNGDIVTMKSSEIRLAARRGNQP
jgi:hypothetical protein